MESLRRDDESDGAPPRSSIDLSRGTAFIVVRPGKSQKHLPDPENRTPPRSRVTDDHIKHVQKTGKPGGSHIEGGGGGDSRRGVRGTGRGGGRGRLRRGAGPRRGDAYRRGDQGRSRGAGREDDDRHVDHR
ncbi:DUF6191 domain-containing protein [Streptomyces sp. NPDC018647]|uniref:DUF6191 domain-containing protein n=1 Tax=Streptomyces sp. NPDC018647 TaxID=3365050 RepID=UPI00378A316B